MRAAVAWPRPASVFAPYKSAALDAMAAELDRITYHQRLGTLADRTARLEALVAATRANDELCSRLAPVPALRDDVERIAARVQRLAQVRA